MKVGDCFLQLCKSGRIVFCVTETDGTSYCDATDIYVEKEGIAYTRRAEEYSIKHMESRISVAPLLYEQLIELKKECRLAIDQLIEQNRGKDAIRFQAVEGNSYVAGVEFISVIKVVTDDEALMSCFRNEDEDIGIQYTNKLVKLNKYSNTMCYPIDSKWVGMANTLCLQYCRKMNELIAPYEK